MNLVKVYKLVGEPPLCGANSGPNNGLDDIGREAAPEEPPPLDVPTEPAHQEVAAAGLWQRMMEHAIIGAAATVPEFIEAPDDDSDGDGPVVTLLARAPTSLHLGVDADDAVWREAARTGSPRYDVEIRAVGAAWRAVATGSAERRHRVEGLRPNVAYCARARRDNGSGARRRACSGAPAARRRGSRPGATSDATEGRVEDRGAVLRLRREPPRRRRPGPAAPHPRVPGALVVCNNVTTLTPASVPHRVPGPGGMRLDGRGGEDVGGGARFHRHSNSHRAGVALEIRGPRPVEAEVQRSRASVFSTTTSTPPRDCATTRRPGPSSWCATPANKMPAKPAAVAGAALALTATSACTTRPTFWRPSSGRKRPPVGTTA